MTMEPQSALVLVVEDEVLIQDLLVDALQEGGFQTIIANDGAEAIAQIDGPLSGQLSGVVTDIRLGVGPDGWAVATRARELNSAVAIVYVSADSSADWPAHGVPGSVMISKPFAAAQVVVALANLANRSDFTG